MQGLGDEPADIVQPEGGQHNLLDPCTGVSSRIASSVRMSGWRRGDLVVPVRPDQQQTAVPQDA